MSQIWQVEKIMTRHTHCKGLSSINLLWFTVSETLPGQNYLDLGHYGNVKVKSGAHHDIVYLHLLPNVPN